MKNGNATLTHEDFHTAPADALIGEAVLVYAGGVTDPVPANVSRVTKKWFYTTLNTGKEAGPFKREYWNYRDEPRYFPAANGNTNPYRYSQVFLYADEAYPKARAAKAREEAAERKARELAEEATRKARNEAEMAEFKKAVENKTGWLLDYSTDHLPDGSRLYTVRLPVKPALVERKGNFEILIARCKNIKDERYRNGEVIEVDKVEVGVTWVNAQTSSFTSCNTWKVDSDEEALWAAGCNRYHAVW